ncbi:3'-5' exonuclease [Edaphobacter modestus]|uniref:DNA 3'-5' helicase n=1 Tax=Edaphobacter modestus TaxID=388466 RepID=A0A4Q7YU37_9BACT|nr:3'-5' exonuclease [Edaphobacter modestus]RZU41090.1 AAA domain-containing protein [Edaphobacter modestus]
MEFRIADTFTASLARLTGEEQKAVKTTAFDLQLNPAHPSLQFHKLDKAKDQNFCSIRVSRDVRLIVHRTGASLLLCYVDHHDPAYQWAERRKLETHPKTGAAQLVEIRERVQEITVPKYVETPASPEPMVEKAPLFATVPEAQLLQYGVPKEWIDDVRGATEDTLLDIVGHLPVEAAEALLNLATGVVPKPLVSEPVSDPFLHPDAQRRFRAVKNVEELEIALNSPWEKWAVFLHPAQRQLVERDFKGPAKVAGSAGTGKTIVALHRAVHLADDNPSARVLLATFSDVLANALQTKLRLLIGRRPRLGEQIEVLSMHEVGLRLYRSQFGAPTIATPTEIRKLLEEASKMSGENKFSDRFLWSEWNHVVDAWQLGAWEQYRDITRLGRRIRLREAERKVLWSIFEQVDAGLAKGKKITEATVFGRLAKHYADGAAPPFDFAVIDEAQDVSVTQLRFLAALGGGRPNSLFFAGDTGQRIFQQPFSWRAMGVDVRGKSSTLKVNYRTSHQIRTHADRLLDSEISDVDGNVEERRGTISVFDGALPEIVEAVTKEEEQSTVADWLRRRTAENYRPDEMVVFVRSAAELPRAEKAAKLAGLPCKALDTHMEPTEGTLALSTMHLAKGLEFRAVTVMCCDEGIIPRQERIEAAGDLVEVEEVYNTERQLLYVACTRARDCLLVTSGGPPSEFLRDLTATQ